MTAGTEPLLCRVRLRLTRPAFVRPAVNLFTIVAETAGADGLKIAETFPEGRGSLQARASAAPPGDGIRHGVAFMPGGGCALPGLRSYDLPLIYSPLLLKLPVLTASKSLRHSRKAVAVSRPVPAQRRRAVRFRARGGAGWRHKCLIRPTGSHHPGPHRSLRQRRANVAYTGVTLASFASRVPR